MKPQKTPKIAKAILRKSKSKAGGITLSDFKLLLQSYCNQNCVWYYYESRHINEWNRIEKPRNKPTYIIN